MKVLVFCALLATVSAATIYDPNDFMGVEEADLARKGAVDSFKQSEHQKKDAIDRDMVSIFQADQKGMQNSSETNLKR